MTACTHRCCAELDHGCPGSKNVWEKEAPSRPRLHSGVQVRGQELRQERCLAAPARASAGPAPQRRTSKGIVPPSTSKASGCARLACSKRAGVSILPLRHRPMMVRRGTGAPAWSAVPLEPPSLGQRRDCAVRLREARVSVAEDAAASHTIAQRDTRDEHRKAQSCGRSLGRCLGVASWVAQAPPWASTGESARAKASWGFDFRVAPLRVLALRVPDRIALHRPQLLLQGTVGPREAGCMGAALVRPPRPLIF